MEELPYYLPSSCNCSTCFDQHINYYWIISWCLSHPPINVSVCDTKSHKELAWPRNRCMTWPSAISTLPEHASLASRCGLLGLCANAFNKLAGRHHSPIGQREVVNFTECCVNIWTEILVFEGNLLDSISDNYARSSMWQIAIDFGAGKLYSRENSVRWSECFPYTRLLIGALIHTRLGGIMLVFSYQ